MLHNSAVKNSRTPGAVAAWVLMLSLPQFSPAWQPSQSGDDAQAVRWAMGIASLPNDRKPAAITPEIEAIHRSRSGPKAELKSRHFSTEVWIQPLDGGWFAVAAFNRGQRAAQVDVIWKELGIGGQPWVRDALKGKDLGKIHGGFAVKLAPGGAALFRVQPTRSIAAPDQPKENPK